MNNEFIIRKLKDKFGFFFVMYYKEKKEKSIAINCSYPAVVYDFHKQYKLLNNLVKKSDYEHIETIYNTILEKGGYR